MILCPLGIWSFHDGLPRETLDFRRGSFPSGQHLACVLPACSWRSKHVLGCTRVHWTSPGAFSLLVLLCPFIVTNWVSLWVMEPEGVLEDPWYSLSCLLFPETRPARVSDRNKRKLGFGGPGFTSKLLCNLGRIALLAPVSLDVKIGRLEV